EGSGRDLDLLIDPSFGFLNRPFTDDRQLTATDLDPDGGKVDPGEVALDHGPLGVTAVVDVDVRGEAARPAAYVGGPAPGAAEHFIHLPAHPGEVGKEISVRHGHIA